MTKTKVIKESIALDIGISGNPMKRNPKLSKNLGVLIRPLSSGKPSLFIRAALSREFQGRRGSQGNRGKQGQGKQGAHEFQASSLKLPFR